MKALDKMDNLDKAGLLCKLFPAELENLQNAIKKQCDYFLQNETAFREGWYQKGFFTAEFWYRLVQNAQKGIDKMNDFGNARTGLQTIFLTDTIQFSLFIA
ncbi:hypothetical protein [Sphingobacterium lactis]|uniref:Uncharacterized protein n=1 Tax=Sphingobacterium lactis TaxID=797291 RepID=A0A1H5TJC5_9SPHI|nr:hypothetical protein [Sphingobacterium lactis]SEF62915.1 hypothetical protein SAMN05421877_1028 [Sphingobacterium lactis]